MTSTLPALPSIPPHLKIGAVHPAEYASRPKHPPSHRPNTVNPPARPYRVTGPTRHNRSITGLTIGAPVHDLSGTRYGALTVLEVWGRLRRAIYFTCRCDCGTVFVTQRQALTSGRTRACRWPGCPYTVHRTRPALPPLPTSAHPRARARTSNATPSHARTSSSSDAERTAPP